MLSQHALLSNSPAAGSEYSSTWWMGDIQMATNSHGIACLQCVCWAIHHLRAASGRATYLAGLDDKGLAHFGELL